MAQDQVSVGMGLLAGSTVMLLTAIWGTCVLVGKCDIEDSRAIDQLNTKGFSLQGTYLFILIIWRCFCTAKRLIRTIIPCFWIYVSSGSGVSTDIWTSYAARIMAISVLPFLVVQLPQALNSSSGRHLAVLIGLILSLLMLISYCVYQVLMRGKGCANTSYNVLLMFVSFEYIQL